MATETNPELEAHMELVDEVVRQAVTARKAIDEAELSFPPSPGHPA